MLSAGICWIENEIVALEDARISVMDHGLLYGDGIFEGLRFYNNRAFLPEPHLQRLAESAKAIALKLPYSLSEIDKLVQLVIASYAQKDGYIRLIITRGKGPLGINPASCKDPQLIIIASPLQMSDEKAQLQGIRTIIASTRSVPPDCLDPRIKSLNYLNPVLARIEANNAGADEAIMLNQQGFVTEGSADNIFIVKKNELYSPPAVDGALAGITRDLMLTLATNAGLNTHIKTLTAFDIYTAEECFLTGTGAELIPVNEVDGRKLSSCPGPVFTQLKNFFIAYLNNQT